MLVVVTVGCLWWRHLGVCGCDNRVFVVVKKEFLTIGYLWLQQWGVCGCDNREFVVMTMCHLWL